MSRLEELVYILVKEMVDQEKKSYKENIVSSLCRQLGCVNPNEVDVDSLVLTGEDKTRLFFGFRIKSGTRLVVPFEKRHIHDMGKLMLCFGMSETKNTITNSRV